MLWLPPARLRTIEHNLAATPSNLRPGTNVFSSATIHTKGAYTTLIAATGEDTHLAYILFSDTSVQATRTDALVDIAIGPAGSEKVILPNLLAGWKAGAQWGVGQLILPLRIPAGTRISARSQSIIASKAVGVAIWLYEGADNPIWPTFIEAEAIGVTAASSIGTSVTPGVGAGVEGAWTNIGGPTTRAYDAIFPMIHGGLANTILTGAGEQWEVGWGGITLGEYFATANTSEWVAGMFPPLPIFQPVPVGTQLQIRGETSLATGAQAKDLAIYGLVG